MTTLAPAPAPASAAPGSSRRESRRIWLLVGGAVLLALVLAIWVSRGDQTYPDPLDPQNPDPEGAQALAQVLGDDGVDVEIVRSAAALEEIRVDEDTTVVVTGTDRLAGSTLDRLTRHAAGGRLVLVEPAFWVLDELGEGTQVGYADGGSYEARCDDPAYDSLELTVDGGTSYPQDGPGGSCFPAAGGHLLTTTDDGVVLFGAGDALSNDQVLRDDNAAIVLRLLGQDERLVWYLPSYDDATEDEAVSLVSLLPDWVVPALWTALIALVALVLWRFRRLGPLSVEPLPVVVRAAETARSRGRMYRRAGDRSHAAGALRAAARRRLAARLRLGRGVGEQALVAVVAQQTGRAEAEIGALLSSTAPIPATDHDLVRVASELARLMREVRRG